MEYDPRHACTLFVGSRRLASGTLEDVAVAAALQGDPLEPLLVFSDSTGNQMDLDLRGSEAQIRERYRAPTLEPPAERGRGRPRLGVVAREVTLLPDQWDWLASQPGGASVALRKLVQEARRAGSTRDRMRRAQERTYKVMVALAGNRPGFEEATRSLFAVDLDAFREHMREWPEDVRKHLIRLADPDDPQA
ncbi:DUF2239 family protein [Ramlibacter monticola]|uniref:DUF2239 family protein n=1 Tax=Ramlibacter monticola TaxID=1926872 RepID=A0A937CQK4_9BURK|nr:DUF2239 family protein [Ramlibacter monticola]MBL0389791.1 DUF2239 family protein [Ramlibacter monticola]